MIPYLKNKHEYLMNKNEIQLIGKVEGNAEMLDERVLRFVLKTTRFSGVEDRAEVYTMPRNVSGLEIIDGKTLYVGGEIRTTDYRENGKRRLGVYIAGTEIHDLDQNNVLASETNECEIIGTLCRKQEIRKTPYGRIIQDGMIAVNNLNLRESYYIPFITWQSTALLFNDFFQLGDSMQIKGRFQSRPYQKIVDGKETDQIAFEVSANKIYLLK